MIRAIETLTKTCVAVIFTASLLLAFQMGDKVNKTSAGLAIKGYDPVAYFEDGKPMKGDAAYQFEWKGATWRFASAAHRESFMQDPARYAPQYGGFCAYGVSDGHTAPVDPEAWSIIGGKLYLNYDKKVREDWKKDTSGRIRKADRNWPKLAGQ